MTDQLSLPLPAPPETDPDLLVPARMVNEWVYCPRLDGIIKPSEDHVLIIDIGPADAVDPRVESLGRPLESIKREAVVV